MASSVALLIEALSVTKVSVARLHLIRTIGRLGRDAREAIPSLFQVLVGDRNQEVRQAAAQALREIKSAN